MSDIEQVERSYRGSADEERELKELYTRFGGDMDRRARVKLCTFSASLTTCRQPGIGGSHPRARTTEQLQVSGRAREEVRRGKGGARQGGEETTPLSSHTSECFTCQSDHHAQPRTHSHLRGGVSERVPQRTRISHRVLRRQLVDDLVQHLRTRRRRQRSQRGRGRLVRWGARASACFPA